jgi:putative DeoR family transcriptional regulator (stage III sporulation protein D)
VDENIKKRVLKNAKLFLENYLTVRKVAAITRVSKSTVHDDLKNKLKDINYGMYLDVLKLLSYNKEVRHIRGGLATKNKYLDVSQ